MFLKEEQVRFLVENFMQRVKTDSLAAMLDVTCHGFSILSAAQKNGVSHQSLSKNLLKLKVLHDKITNTGHLFPSSHLLEENARALLLAETSFASAKVLLIDICLELGGRVERGDLYQEVKLFLDQTVTSIFMNPDDNYDREWSFDHNDAV